VFCKDLIICNQKPKCGEIVRIVISNELMYIVIVYFEKVQTLSVDQREGHNTIKGERFLLLLPKPTKIQLTTPRHILSMAKKLTQAT